VDYNSSQKYGVWLTERGSSFGYGNLVVDMRSLKIMRGYAPVIFDATHSVQSPASGESTSGGDSEMVPYLARGASAVGVDGMFFETHFNPKIALSDGANMIKMRELERLMEQIDHDKGYCRRLIMGRYLYFGPLYYHFLILGLYLLRRIRIRILGGD